MKVLLPIPLCLLLITLSGCISPSYQSSADSAKDWTIELTSNAPLPSGSCSIYDAQHRLMLKGDLFEGKMDGTWISYGSDGGLLASITYHQGQKNGPVKMWFSYLSGPSAAGRIKLTGAFVDGEYDGTVTRLYSSGEPQIVRIYKNGIIQSSRYWSQNGQESSKTIASNNAKSFNFQDVQYFGSIENMVTQALDSARREIKPSGTSSN